FEVGGSPGCIPLFLLRDCSIVIGTCIIGFEFDCAGIISNCAIPIVILRSGIAAVVVSSRFWRAELDGLGVVGNGAGRILLQPFGLGSVIIRGVIFWIEPN